MHQQRAESHFLPAARTGIMQSHRVIASSLFSRSARAGLEDFPKLPTLSGVTADFLQSLILYDVNVLKNKSRSGELQAKALNDVADDMERMTLGGKILTRTSTGSNPEFVYRPPNSKKDIRLSRVSSMVSELAPVILTVRSNLQFGDLLIFEEPEAHLHPVVQTEMAAILARLVRCGVRVLVTTHSDWLLKEIGNLIRQGELEGKTPENTNEPSSACWLRPKDVGIWLFQNEGAGSGSKIREIEFDRVEGIEPYDYDDVAEKLYNRSAELQNRLLELDARETAQD